jgi:phage shock protein C
MRSWSDKKIAGVCAGFAKYFDTDVTLVRLLWVVLTVVPGAFVGGALVYLLAWIIMPMEPEPVAAQSSPAQSVSSS